MQWTMNWSLGQLRTFVAVADHGTMTAAARELRRAGAAAVLPFALALRA